MQTRKKWSELSWGLISGVSSGLGASIGVAWRSWELFFLVTLVIAALMIWWARRVR